MLLGEFSLAVFTIIDDDSMSVCIIVLVYNNDVDALSL